MAVAGIFFSETRSVTIQLSKIDEDVYFFTRYFTIKYHYT